LNVDPADNRPLANGTGIFLLRTRIYLQVAAVDLIQVLALSRGDCWISVQNDEISN